MQKYLLLGDSNDGDLIEVPEDCDFRPRLVNCQSRSNCEHYLNGEGEVQCPLALLRDETEILIGKED